jgi:NADH-quinone oxidoreductase subunit M
MEVALWIVAAGRYDFDDGGLQLSTSTEWVKSLGISYSVGFYGFSIWLVGVTVVVSAAAIGYALWVGRDRPRAYHALMLGLTGAVVATFAAQDLLLFYVSFEAMLIPLYVLVGVWGGERRATATLTFVVYTMVGSLLMLAAVVAFGVSQGTFSLVDSGTSDNTWIFLGFAVAFAIKAPLFPFHGWLPLAYREAPVEVAAVLSAIVSKTAVFGFLRIALPKFPEPVDDLTGLILVLAGAGLVYGSVLAFRSGDLRGIVAYSSLAQMGLITTGIFAFDGLRHLRGRVPDHGRRVRPGLGLLGDRRARRRARGDVRPAPHLRRPARAAGTGREGRGTRPPPGRARTRSAAPRLPARALVLAGTRQRELVRG